MPSSIDPRHPQRTSLKKWLPAIAFAIGINVIFIGIFLWGHHKELNDKTQANDQGDNAVNVSEGQKTSNKNSSLVINTALENDKSAVQTLTDTKGDNDTIKDPKKLNEQSEPARQMKKDVNDNKVLKANDNVESHPAKATNNKASASIGLNSVALNNEALNVQPPALQPSRNNSNSEDLINHSPQRGSNPNDRLLLPMDIPKVEAQSREPESIMTEDEGFNNAALEAQRINEQLSDAINTVKQQKMEALKAEQERIKYYDPKNNNAASESIENNN